MSHTNGTPKEATVPPDLSHFPSQRLPLPSATQNVNLTPSPTDSP